MSNELVQVTFDYTLLNEDTRIFVKVKAEAIQSRLKRTAEDIIAIGQDLIAVKDRLGHGEFLPWLKAEFDMTDMSAQRFMQVANKFGVDTKSNNLLDLSASVLYLLAAPSTPETIVKEVLSGEIKATEDQTLLEVVREAKRAAVDAVKAKRKAEEEAATLQQQLTWKEEEAEVAKSEREALRRKLENTPEPEPQKQIIYVDTLETAEKVASLEEQIRSLEDKPVIPPSVELEIQKIKSNLKNAQDELNFYTKQNAALAEKNKQLSEESTRNYVEHIATVGHLRICQEWQFANGDIVSSHQKFDGRIPGAIDREAFGAEQHARTWQSIEAMEHTISLLKQTLPHNDNNMIDASSIVESPVSYISYTGDSHG